MTLRYPSTHKLIKQVSDLAAPLNDTNLEKFIRYFFSYTSLEDLENHSIDTLYHIALSQWQLMAVCAPDEIKVSVKNPSIESDEWVSPYTIVQVVMKDMPFLVDSLRMTLTRLGLSYNLIIHVGGICIKRDENQQVVSVQRYKGQMVRNGQIESPIFIEVDKQSDDALHGLQQALESVVNDVASAVRDWPAMVQRLRETIDGLTPQPSQADENELDESRSFLNWLLDDNFTFLGARDYSVSGTEDELALDLVPGSGLGVLSDEGESLKKRLLNQLPMQARELFTSNKTRIIISKTNTISTVHRPVYTDYIGIKLFDDEHRLIGERRFIGLYTSSAYSVDPESIPFLRHKVAYVIQKSQLPSRSHSGKDLSHILSTLPRDDLFQANKQELFHLAMGILSLQERRSTRLFIREDAYGRYMSCFVFVPRDIFNTHLLRKIQQVLMTALDGIDVSFNTMFTASILTRIHFTIRVDSSQRRRINVLDIEKSLVEASKSWVDTLRESLVKHYGGMQGLPLFNKYRAAFSAAYRDKFTAEQAVHDLIYTESLQAENIVLKVYHPVDEPLNMLKLKVFHYDQPIPLSDALPILENLGFRVVGEEPYELTLSDNKAVFINDFRMSYIYGDLPELNDISTLLEEAFIALWEERAENDEFNHLIIYAQFTWRQVSVLRAYTKYLQQLGGLPFSVKYVAETFIHNREVSQVLLKIFQSHFDPVDRVCIEETDAHENKFLELLDSVKSLDEDRTFRRFLDLIKATLRTNFFTVCEHADLPALSFKISPRDIPDAPKPLPMYEIFVYSPQFEGVHLRMAKVARGGIRWSDRREDFRTEVLGLMKAQQVKNSVIVPSGAKGGFVVKKPLMNLSREAVYEEGVRCYKGFIQGLLDLTDNLVDGQIVHPKSVLLRDSDDPYLVVAADKGTATFSDIANEIAISRDFWLQDAFASGGSAGYDHKKMGITARGAWVSAERQFQEIGINVNKAQIKVVGIGDMSGDVFGNGLLLSNQLQLVAAFNHLHIFLDPNPDPAVSFAERQRLFELRRSTWADYDEQLISKGGGVYSRASKSIALTPEVQLLLDTTEEKVVPSQLIRLIMKAPVDMIWNGGIGTYIKSSAESNMAVGDRANDILRIDGNECRARVICEGGNLGVTQLGRIEYELNGGKINTDFIDNSAGVDCSDHEVNIKILLNAVIAQGDMTHKQRNVLLAEMTDEVAHLVLENNYAQNKALSLAAYTSGQFMDVYRRMMDYLSSLGQLDRAIEFLPDDKTMIDRKTSNQSLTKPELSVLLSYAKIYIEQTLCNSELLQSPTLRAYALEVFPAPLSNRFADQILAHPLYADIVAMQLSNHIVSDMGITFTYTMFDETGASLERIICAYLASQHIFHLRELYREIRALDYKVDAQVQYEMMTDVKRLVRRATRWFLRNHQTCQDVESVADFFTTHVEALTGNLTDLLIGADKERYDSRCSYLTDIGVPEDIACKIARCDSVYHLLNIVEIAKNFEYDYQLTAECYFAIVDKLDLHWLRSFIDRYDNTTHWMILAKASYKGDLDWIQRILARSLLELTVQHGGQFSDQVLSQWLVKNEQTLQRWNETCQQLKSVERYEFPMLTVAIRELSEIAKFVL